jgi:hypothetical protein
MLMQLRRRFGMSDFAVLRLEPPSQRKRLSTTNIGGRMSANIERNVEPKAGTYPPGNLAGNA